MGEPAIRQHLQAAQVILSRVRELCEQIDHRGHEHGVSHMLSFHGLAESLCAKFSEL